MKQRKIKLAMLCITAALLTTANAAPADAREIKHNQDNGTPKQTPVKSNGLYAGISAVTTLAAETYQAELEAAKTAPEEKTPELAVAQVDSYIHVRNQPSIEGEVVGKLHNDSVGEIIGEESQGEWLLIQSGNVEGYIKSEYALRGEEGLEKAEEVGKRYAKITTETLRVRQEATTESDIVTLLPLEEVLPVQEETEGWAKITTQQGEGYISTDYAELYTEHKTAESKEEEEARLRREEEERLAAEAERVAGETADSSFLSDNSTSGSLETGASASGNSAANSSVSDNFGSGSSSSGNSGSGGSSSGNSGSGGSSSGNSGSGSSSSGNSGSGSSPSSSQAASPSHDSSNQPAANSSLGQSIADYALKFVGNPYVYGGTSLTNGADCSGFVQSVYLHFGISLPRTSGEQGQCGTNAGGINNAMPGDIIAYSGHVGIYIGNGQIVHASSAKTGIKVSNANYRPIVSVRRIV